MLRFQQNAELTLFMKRLISYFIQVIFFSQKRATCEKKEIQSVLRGPILSVLLRFACSI